MNLSPGLNVVLATKSRRAKDKQTRKGAGKTSLVETIHFVLGANADPKSIFRSKELRESQFSVAFDLYGQSVTTSRSGLKKDKISVTGDVSNWPTDNYELLVDKKVQLSNEEWKKVLGHAFFEVDIAAEESQQVSFRQLFPYFARRARSDGFLEPLQHTRSQTVFSKQVAGSRLLGLDERIAQKLQALREKTKLISTLKKATKGNSLKNYLPSSASLRSDLVIAKSKASKLRDRINSFEVVDEYENLEKEANTLTMDISNLNDQNVIDREHITILQEAVDTESPPRVDYVEKVFQDAGVLFETSVQRRYDEAQQFYEAVIRNRKEHLANELKETKLRLEKRNQLRGKLDQRRKKLMEILSSGGALEHYNELREELARHESAVESINLKLEDALELESTTAELKTERSKLHLALQNDYRERANLIEKAVLSFEELSNALYNEAGKLTITATENGPEFAFDILKQESKGISNMQIFCFDLMLMDLLNSKKMGPGFLIHDSHLFDGVDERQVASALQLGARHSETNGYQYIVTLNSDSLPREGFDSDFDINSYINDVQLTDEEESGGLFGLSIG